MKNYRRQIELYLYRREEIKLSENRVERSWSRAIEKVIKSYSDSELNEFIRCKYAAGMTEKQIRNKLGIEHTTYWTWTNKVINDIALYAAQKRLIKPFE